MDLDQAKHILGLIEPYSVGEMVNVIRVFCTQPPILFNAELVLRPAAGAPHATTRPYTRLQRAENPNMVSITMNDLTRLGAEAVARLAQNQLDVTTATILRDIANRWADLDDYYLAHPVLLPPEQIAQIRGYNNVTFACFLVLQAYANSRIHMQRAVRGIQGGREGEPNLSLIALRF